jgi:hypothetical protein
MSMTEERLIQLNASIETNKTSLAQLESTHVNDIWLETIKLF